MADINKELTQIKTAIYGKDVRGAIHDGIDKINKESEDSKQKANEAHDVMESIINDGFDNAALEANFEQKLDDKIGQLQPEWTQFQTDVTSQLNETNSQLAQTSTEIENVRSVKMDKDTTDIAVGQININLGKFDQTYVTDEFLQQMAGTTPINAVPADKSITTSKIVNDAIDLDIIQNKLLTGTLVKSISTSTVDFNFANNEIVVQNTNLFYGGKFKHFTGTYPVVVLTDVTNTTYLLYFNPDANLIEYVDPLELATVPINAVFFGSFNPISKSVFGISEYTIDGVAPDVKDGYIAEFNGSKLTNNSVASEKLRDDIVSLSKVKKNLLTGIVMKTTAPGNYEINFIDKYLDLKNVSIIYGGTRTYLTSAHPQLSFTEATEHQTYAVLLDITKAHGSQLSYVIQRDIGTVSSNNIVIGAFNPVTYEVYDMDNIKITKPSSSTEPEPDNPEEIKYVQEIERMTALKTMEDASATGLDIYTYLSADVFAKYDELMNQFPNYITKELVTNEATGLPIYRYNLRPRKITVERTTEVTKRPHLFLVAGVHPSEKAGWWSLYNTIKEIVTNWKSSPILKALRWDVDISVIPIVNVWGLDNNSGRNNSNGVDINRNFPAGWVQGTPGTAGYGGETPNSEIETQALMDIMANEEIDYYGDFHNFFSNSNTNYFIWNIASDMHNAAISEKLITHISQKWKEENTEIPQDDDVLFGRISMPTGGSSPAQLQEFGINGSIFEVCQKVMFEPNPKDLNSLAISLGVDAQTNILYQMYRNIAN